MADFIDKEAEESDEELDEYTEKEKKKLRKLRNESDDEEDEDEEQFQEELQDLIDDNPIDEEEEEEDIDRGRDHRKRKKKDDDEDDNFDDGLDDEDLDLLEENLGVKINRQKKFKRLRRIEEEESDEEVRNDAEAIANELFEGSDQEDEHRSRDGDRDEEEFKEHSESEGEYSETDDFIVDDEGRPISKKKRRPIFSDAALQEAQDIFGVDFDYNDFEKYEYDEEMEEDEEEYENEEDEYGERVYRPKPKKTRKGTSRKSIYEVYEPYDLERGHFTDLDNEIRNTDLPERMQLRSVPVTATAEGSDDKELDQEAEWIYKQAFSNATISNQEGLRDDFNHDKGSQVIPKIRKALDFMRNLNLEVPFIAFYRKEYVEPELNINDLWLIYKYDEKWCQLQIRKTNLLKLFEKMEKYLEELIMRNADQPLPEDLRLVKPDDYERLRSIQSVEELKDIYCHFLLYYGQELSNMQEFWRKKNIEDARQRKIEEKRKQLEEEGDPKDPAEVEEVPDDDIADDIDESAQETIKQAIRSDPYSICKRAGLEPLSRKFGLTPEQFGENLRDNYQRHEVEQHPVDPLEVAEDFVNKKFAVKEDILKAAKFMVATQLSKEPLVRHCVRETFFEKAQISIKPTKKGLKEIDENHPCYSMKYIQDKPVRDLCGDQFLKLIIAEEDKLLEIGLGQNIRGATGINYVEEVKQYYYKDEFSRTVQEWNDLRGAAVEMTLNNFLFPLFRKELKAKLISESKEYVKKACAKRIYDWLKVLPYSIEYPDEDDDDWDTSGGLKVMGLAYSPDPEIASYASVVNPTGECSSFIKLQNLLFRKDGWKQEEKMAKEKTLNLLKSFISNNKPHIICVGGESREALMILEDLRFVVSQLVEDEQIPQIPVELLENSLAKVFANSVKSETEFREYPPLLKQSISLARRIQDPLVEFSQLCTVDEEILCLQYHSLQSRLSKEELLETAFQEFINRTNEVGVDLNQVVAQPHTINLLQFICGLGPRKAHALIKTLKQSNSRLENRTQLVTTCHMGPKVFINCAGFIKIDTNSLGDSTDAYVEVLDGSRVHPETYEWARKMAVDALEYDEMQEDANPAGALEEILETPEKLKDLDLDAFAEELKRQGFGNKKITLYDIRAELTHRYKDLRTPYQPPNPEEVFNMLTKETPETFYIGKLIMCSVIGTAHRKPKGEQLDKANPVRNDENGMWQCPFCTKCDFQELSEVWNHFDAGSCPGQAVGIRIRLDNGISGFIPIKFLSDNTVNNPDERVHRGQVIHARITKIDVEKFTIECTSRSSDLLDKNGDLKPPKDPFYDYESEIRDEKTEDERAKLRQRQTYIKRVIVHPSFKNIGYAKTESMMADMDQGEVIFRPSSKASDHLTVTWKVTDNVYQHIDIRESGKENAFSLGQSLWIGNEEFEDLDEIMARHITPMSAHARDLLNFRYYRDTDGGKREISEEMLKEDRKKNSSKIHYLVSSSKEFPGKFLLSYLPRQRVYHEYITVTPQGYRFRKQNFGTLAHLFRWFKEHFRDPVPATPSTPRSVQGGASVRTPYMNAHTPSYPSTTATPVNNPTHPLPTSQMIHPAHFAHSATNAYGGAYSYVNTPYTPSGQTPYMTPFQTPHNTQTPRYGNHTPNHFPNSRGYNSTPYTPGPHTPHNNFTSHSRHPRTPNENSNWQRNSNDSWSGHGRNNRNQGRFNRDNQKSFYNNYSDNSRKSTGGISAEEAGRTTPDFDAEETTSNQSPQPVINSSNIRSGTSTPQTNTSPRSMMESVAGDATPLYDE